MKPLAILTAGYFVLVASAIAAPTTAPVDLATLPAVKNAAVNSNVTVPAANYTLSATLILRFDLTFAPGCTLTYTGTGEPFLQAEPGNVLNGNGCTCEHCPTYFVCANQPRCIVENFVLGMNPSTSPGSIGGGACPQRGATNFLCRNFTVGVVEEYPAFAQEDGFQAVNWDVYGSVKQASFRGDNDGVTKNSNGTFKTPTDIIISGGTWRHYAGNANTQLLECRQASVTVKGGAVLCGNAVSGQGTQRTQPPPTPVQPFQPGENGTLVYEDCTVQDMPAGAAGVGVRLGSIFQWSKSKTIWKTTLPMNQVVVSGGGTIQEMP
jgi:hypothetical protein